MYGGRGAARGARRGGRALPPLSLVWVCAATMGHQLVDDTLNVSAEDCPTARALGSEWARLPPVVRELHGPCTATGRFAIERGKGWRVAAVASLFRLPATGRDVATTLEITPGRDVFTWARRFGAQPLVTFQRALGMARWPSASARSNASSCPPASSSQASGILGQPWVGATGTGRGGNGGRQSDDSVAPRRCRLVWPSPPVTTIHASGMTTVLKVCSS